MTFPTQLRKITIVSLTALAFTGIVAYMPSAAIANEKPLAGILQPGTPVSFADLVEQVSPAVVSINVTIKKPLPAQSMGNFDELPDGLREWLERQMPGFGQPDGPRMREGRGLGSGFLISTDGYVVTNHHVVNNATEIKVRFQDSREFDAKLIGSDQRTDLAVLKIESDEKFPHVKFADDVKVRVGDWVVAVGNPFGLGGTATAGIVSATGREIGNSAYNFIQLDASINQGNSGGPTFDLYGNVVGVNSQILSPSGGNIGIGFAIPAKLASKITTELIEKGEVTRGWLGVSVQRVDEDMAASQGLERPSGALVADVVEDSPAADAGFKDGDIILKLDGTDIEDQRDLTRRVGDLFVGHKAKFTILRNGMQKTLRVKIGKRDEAKLSASGVETARDKADEFGMVLAPLDEEGRDALGISDKRGVRIVRVKPDSKAARKGIRSGYAILSANNTDVFSPEDFTKAIEKARKKKQKAVRLLVRNPRGQSYTALRLDDMD